MSLEVFLGPEDMCIRWMVGDAQLPLAQMEEGYDSTSEQIIATILSGIVHERVRTVFDSFSGQLQGPVKCTVIDGRDKSETVRTFLLWRPEVTCMKVCGSFPPQLRPRVELIA